MTPVIDPNILSQLNGSGLTPVTDPNVLAQLNGQQTDNRVLADKPGYEYGNILPFKKNTATGDTSFAFPEMIRSPIRGMQDLETTANNGSVATGQPTITPDAVNAMASMFLPFGGAESQGMAPMEGPLPADPMGKLSYALENAQQDTRFSRPTNALRAGQEANQAISHQYGIDTSLQRELYGNLNDVGSKFSMPADEVYNRLDDLTGYLKDKIAPEMPENRALSQLQEIRDNLQSKNSVPQIGVKPVPDATGEIPIQDDYQPGIKAYGLQPSDAVDIKTTLNQLVKSGKFTNAGQAKILDFKNYIQDFLNQASDVHPEFGNALTKAETQAARVGMYHDPKLAGLWQPKPDYLSYKGETTPSAETFDRMANFMDKLNSGSPAAGESYSLAQILPHEQLQNIFRNALLQNKEYPSGIFGNLKTLGGLTRTMGASPDSPLLNLADQLRGMQ